jgi:DHA1 family inner membrane transport protein
VAFAPPVALFAGAGTLAALSALAARSLPDDATHRAGEPPAARMWLSAAMPVYLVTSGVGIAYGLLVASLPARLAELGWSPASAGVLFAVMSGVSMLVGIALAARGGVGTRGRGAVAGLLVVFAAATALLAVAPAPWLAVAAMALFGLPLSPLSVIGSARLAEQVPESAHAQALAIFAAAVTTTSGLGLALAALLIGVAGPSGALAGSTAACVLTAMAVLHQRRERQTAAFHVTGGART